MTSAVGENIFKEHNRNQAERIFINSSFFFFSLINKKEIPSNTVKNEIMKFSGLKKKKKL